MSKQPRKWMPKLTLLAFTVVVSLILLEVGMRNLPTLPSTWRPVDGDPYPATGAAVWSMYVDHMPKPNWRGPRSRTDDDKVDGVPEFDLEYNSLGMRGPEIPPKTKPRVFLLGDSFTEADELPISALPSELLNRGPLSNEVEVFQHGFSSWSPVLEFSWLRHFGSDLSVDRVYLFVLDNDFFSPEAYPKADPQYRRMFSFDEHGAPAVIDAYDTFLPEIVSKSYLVRSLDAVAATFFTKVSLLDQLWADPMPVRQKVTRVADRFRFGRPLFYQIVSGDMRTTLNHYVDENFPWDSAYDLEHVLLRLPESDWTATTTESVRSTFRSIHDFARYLGTRNSELTVVYIPLGVDIDAQECTGCRKAINLRDGMFFERSGLEEFLERELRTIGVPFINLRAPLVEYKEQRCSMCSNFLYFERDGHWNVNGQLAVAERLKADLIEYPVSTSMPENNREQ